MTTQKNRHWIKLWLTVLDDPKCGALPDDQWRLMVECFLVAGEQGNEGKLPVLPALAWRLRRNIDELEPVLEGLAGTGIVRRLKSGWRVSKFAKRQRAVSAQDRLRSFRRNETETQLQRPVASTNNNVKRPVAQRREEKKREKRREKRRGEKTERPPTNKRERYL